MNTLLYSQAIFRLVAAPQSLELIQTYNTKGNLSDNI